MVVATIKKQSAFQLKSSADVYIHNVSWGKMLILHLLNLNLNPGLMFTPIVYIHNVRLKKS